MLDHREEPEVNGWPIPAAIMALIRSDRWRMPGDADVLARVFGENSLRATLLSLGGMRRESPPQNPIWTSDRQHLFLGEPDLEHPPGDADAEYLVVIGDLGPDRPLALDFRTKPEPRVVLLTCERWTTVAVDVAAFITALHL